MGHRRMTSMIRLLQWELFNFASISYSPNKPLASQYLCNIHRVNSAHFYNFEIKFLANLFNQIKQSCFTQLEITLNISTTKEGNGIQFSNIIITFKEWRERNRLVIKEGGGGGLRVHFIFRIYYTLTSDVKFRSSFHNFTFTYFLTFLMNIVVLEVIAKLTCCYTVTFNYCRTIHMSLLYKNIPVLIQVFFNLSSVFFVPGSGTLNIFYHLICIWSWVK